MPGEAEHIHAQPPHIQVEKAGRLHRIGVQHNGTIQFLSPPPHRGRYIGKGVNRANFVVGVHYGNQGSAGADGVIHRFRANHPERVHRQIGNFITPVFQVLAGVQDGVVFDAGGDEVIAGFVQGGSYPVQGRVVRLGAAAGEHHLAAATAQHFRHPLPGVVQGVLGLLPDGVDAGGIAVQLGEVGPHRVKDPRVHRRSAGVIQIDKPGRGHRQPQLIPGCIVAQPPPARDICPLRRFPFCWGVFSPLRSVVGHFLRSS